MQVYLKTTAGGRTIVTWHLAWDAERFIAARQADAKAAGRGKKAVVVEEATAAEYEAFMGYKRPAREKRRGK